MLWFHSLDGDSLSSNCTCNQECSCFNPVRDHPVFRAVQLRHTFDDDSTRSRAFDLCAHFVQERSQVHHLGFLCRSINNCDSIGQHGRHHHVISTQDSRTKSAMHVDYCSAQFRCKNLDIAALHTHRRAERFETFEVQINWPVADDATSGQSDGRLLASTQRRSKHTHGSAHLPHDIVRGHRVDLFCRDADGATCPLYLRTQVS